MGRSGTDCFRKASQRALTLHGRSASMVRRNLTGIGAQDHRAGAVGEYIFPGSTTGNRLSKSLLHSVLGMVPGQHRVRTRRSWFQGSVQLFGEFAATLSAG